MCANKDETQPMIFVVEDDTAMCQMATIALRKAGYRVQAFENGDEADLEIRAVKPDLVLVDIALPGKCGFDIALDLKKDAAYRHIPVIIMTSLTQNQDMGDDYWREKSCADDHLTKPFPMGNLVERVGALLQSPSAAAVSHSGEKSTWYQQLKKRMRKES